MSIPYRFTDLSSSTTRRLSGLSLARERHHLRAAVPSVGGAGVSRGL